MDTPLRYLVPDRQLVRINDPSETEPIYVVRNVGYVVVQFVDSGDADTESEVRTKCFTVLHLFDCFSLQSETSGAEWPAHIQTGRGMDADGPPADQAGVLTLIIFGQRL